MLDQLAATLRGRDSDRPAVIGALTRGELADLADRYAVALHHGGLSPGDTLGVAVRPGPRALAVMLAAQGRRQLVEHQRGSGVRPLLPPSRYQRAAPRRP